MRAKKLIINGEEHDIGGSGSTKFPGLCTLDIDSLETGSIDTGVATIEAGEIKDWVIVMMENRTGNNLRYITIDGDTCELIGAPCDQYDNVLQSNSAGYGIFMRDEVQDCIFILDLQTVV